MALGIRKFIVGSISKIDPPELYPLNRWMKRPGVEKETVEGLYASLGDVSFVDLIVPDSSIDFTGKFFRDTSGESYILVLFPKVKSSPLFFAFKKIIVKPTQVTFPDVECFGADDLSLGPLLTPVESRKVGGVEFKVNIEYLNLLDWGGFR